MSNYNLEAQERWGGTDTYRDHEQKTTKIGSLLDPDFGRRVHNRPNFNGDTPSGRNIFPNSRKSLYL